MASERDDLEERLARLEDLAARLVALAKTTPAGRVILRRLGLM